MSKKILITLVIVILIAALAWFFFLRAPSQTAPTPGEPSGPGGFQPFERPPRQGSGQGTNEPISPSTSGTSTSVTGEPISVPVLRMISETPVGGYGVSTTPQTSVVRWMDRGRGNVYETDGFSLDVRTLSNTVVPRVFESIWNRNLTAVIGTMLENSDGEARTLYAEIVARKLDSASTTASVNPDEFTEYELKGKNMPNNILAYAASPRRDSVFLLIEENGRAVGYTATFSGSSMKRVADMPFMQVNIEWPETDTVAITTKGSAEHPGYLYLLNLRTGALRKAAGPLPGLSAKVSRDAKYAILSATGSGQNVVTSVFDLTQSKGTDAVIRTLADKCVWGNFYKELVYCAVPSNLDQAVYPDDWYRGNVSTNDRIWQVNAKTGETNLVSSLPMEEEILIDGYNLTLDEKDAFLFFMNKRDLSLWSLDLVSLSDI